MEFPFKITLALLDTRCSTKEVEGYNSINNESFSKPTHVFSEVFILRLYILRYVMCNRKSLNETALKCMHNDTKTDAYL